MNDDILLKRDMLYLAEKNLAPGCILVKVLSPDYNSKLPVIIEERSGLCPLDHIEEIVSAVYDEILKRVSVDMEKDVLLYLKCNEDMKNKYITDYVKINVIGETISIESASISREK